MDHSSVNWYLPSVNNGHWLVLRAVLLRRFSHVRKSRAQLANIQASLTRTIAKNRDLMSQDQGPGTRSIYSGFRSA